MSTAMSHRSAVMIGKETTFGTAVGATVAVPATQESFQVDEGAEFDGAMRNDPTDLIAVEGLRKVKGGMNISPNGAEIGRLLQAAFGSVSSSGLAPTIGGTPTATPAAGGTLPDGESYRYKVAPVLKHLDSGLTMIGNPSANSSAQASTDATNRTIQVGWLGVTAPEGYSLSGYAIFRTEHNGSAGSEKWLTFVEGGGTVSYNDDGSAGLDNAAAKPADVYKHAFTRSTSGELPSFTAEIRKDNGDSERYTGLKLNSLKLSMQPDQTIGMDLDWIGKDVDIVSASTPSFALVSPFRGHRVVFYLMDEGEPDTLFSLATKCEVTVANNLAERWNLNNSRTLRALKVGRQEVTGSFEADHESMALFSDFLANEGKALKMIVFGPPSSDLDKDITVGGQPVTATAWRYTLEVYVPTAYLLTHQANSQGANPIVQQLNFRAVKDSGVGAAIRVTLHNLTPSYS